MSEYFHTTDRTETPAQTGERVGRAMARDVIADGLPRTWTGLDAQDGDQLTSAGLTPNTPEWAEAERAAERAYREALSDE